MGKRKKGNLKDYHVVLCILFLLTILSFSYNLPISLAEEKAKGSVKESVKETKEAISEKTKEIADEVRKKKKIVIEDIKEGWLSVKKSVKDTYSSAKEELTETAITAKVKAKLLAGKKRAAFKNIEVNTKDHTVTLTGKVKTAKDAADAIETTLSVSGVEKVISRLEVER
ncbi:MAG: BON domain-containing protein [Nitrospirae bacterium]|nr:BON domain-containing protein [Nitrospirota bacterium]